MTFAFYEGLCEDSVLFCQNYNVKRLTAVVDANPLRYKVVAQVVKEWTSTSATANSNDIPLSPGKYRSIDLFIYFFLQFFFLVFDLAAYFLNGSPHLIEPVAPRQPTFNVMPRRITNEDFFQILIIMYADPIDSCSINLNELTLGIQR